MPSSRLEALEFLETQWSSINENKVKGILAELRFKKHLAHNNYHYVPGGWIITPGNPSITSVPADAKVCILPRRHQFSWEAGGVSSTPTLAETAAYHHFKQVGMQVLFAEPALIVESSFEPPRAGVKSAPSTLPRPYSLELKEISGPSQFKAVPAATAFAKFPRKTRRGGRVYTTGRIDPQTPPWNDASAVADLFWFEYARYYFQVDYLVSNNDLDLFVIGPSGRSYPVEVKSKTASQSAALGDWFGIDAGPFAKLAFFTANAMNNDALYVVEEVTETRAHIAWHGIRFTDLVKACSWVVQGGGQGMTGGASATFKIPKAAFRPLDDLLKML